MSEEKVEKGSVIDDHRNMLIFSGNLSSFHLDNLKTFPKIVFDDIKNFTLHYDFYTGKGDDKKLCSGKVIYDIVFEKDPDLTTEELQKRMSDLKFWVRTLFWKDTRVTVKKNGKRWT